MVSVIVPLHSGDHELARLAAELRRQPGGREVELIAVNDGAGATVTGAVRPLVDHVVELAANVGAAAARNAGMEVSRGGIIAFVDDTVQVCPGWLPAVLRSIEAGADYVCGPVRVRLVRRGSVAAHYEARFEHRVDRYFGEERFGVTANLAVRRELIQAIGGFDQRLRSGHDRELGIRVRRDGRFRQVFATEMAVLHPSRPALAQFARTRRIGQAMALYDRLFGRRETGSGGEERGSRTGPAGWVRRQAGLLRVDAGGRVAVLAWALLHRAVLRWTWTTRRTWRTERLMRFGRWG